MRNPTLVQRRLLRRCCSYFKVIKTPEDEDLLVLPTDACLFEDEGFRPFAEKYLADEAAFFADYAASHLKLSELGVEWEGEPVTLTKVTLNKA